jgi:hypothetical protein
MSSGQWSVVSGQLRRCPLSVVSCPLFLPIKLSFHVAGAEPMKLKQLTTGH